MKCMKKNDIKLLIGILLLTLAVFLGYRLFYTRTGDTVQITVNGRLTKTLPLNRTATYTIQTDNGKNILQIKNGFAVITDADCPDKLCVHQEKISKQGQTLVCLPHKVIVSISSSGKPADALDGVAR